MKVLDRCHQYALDVVSGEIIAGQNVINACERFLSDLTDGKAKGLFYDIEKSNRIFNFFERILTTGGDNFILHSSQCFILGNLFGWYAPYFEQQFDVRGRAIKDREGNDVYQMDGYARRFRRAYIEIGKGNGKTPLMAGVGLYGLLADNEPEAHIYFAAAKKEQAMIAFSDAREMVRNNEKLNKICKITGGDNIPNIANIPSGSFMRVMSSERSKSGFRPHFALCDEIHEHPSRETIDMLELGFKGRRSPLLMMITNSGFDKKSACWEEHNHAAKVAAGEVMDDKTFSFICSLDKGDDPINDSKCWIKANPLLGVVVKDNVLKEAVKQAIQIPGKKNNIMRLHFCEWTDAETSWISSETWTECEHELDIDDFISKPCYGGLDLSSKLDLTALARVFENDDGMLNAFVDFWKPKDTLYDTEIKDRAPYTTWLNQGYLHAPAGSSIDYEVVASDIIAMGDFEQINFDRWRIDFFKKHLSDIGYELPLEPFGQGFKDMSPAIEKLEELIFNKKIKIHINPVLRWNAASVKIEEDAAGNRKMSKIKSTGRIDGIIALLMAIAAYNANNKNITVELNIRQL